MARRPADGEGSQGIPQGAQNGGQCDPGITEGCAEDEKEIEEYLQPQTVAIVARERRTFLQERRTPFLLMRI
jgi:hypothetical protein